MEVDEVVIAFTFKSYRLRHLVIQGQVNDAMAGMYSRA